MAGTDIVTVLVTGVSDDFVFYENNGGNYSIVGREMKLVRFISLN